MLDQVAWPPKLMERFGVSRRNFQDQLRKSGTIDKTRRAVGHRAGLGDLNLYKSGFDPTVNVRLRHSFNGGHFRRGGLDVVKDLAVREISSPVFYTYVFRVAPNSRPSTVALLG